jgi:hypothetical protein
MARYGIGILVDEQAAYEFYLLAHSVKQDVFTYERLGYCYLDGIGVATDRQKAFDYFLKCAVDGYSAGLYKLSEFAEEIEIDLTTLYKAVSNNVYSGFFDEDLAMQYSSYDYYAANSARRDLIEKLSDIWESEPHPIVQSNDYFPKKFVEELIKTAYTHSFGTFAKKYIIPANRTHEDAHKFSFHLTDDELEWDIEQYAASRIGSEYYVFYEYDFDGCGVDEIAVSTASGAGGSTMGDGYAIFKKNSDGLYEYFADGPWCALRDNMRIINYDDRIYFIFNLFDETGNEPHNIVAYTIDTSGKGHTLTISLKDYSPQHILTYTDAAYAFGCDEMLSNIDNQARTALQDARYQRIYSPEREKQLAFQPDEGLWHENFRWYKTPQDIFFVADIYNNGMETVIHKGRSLSHHKGYSYFSWIEIYKDRDGFDSGTVSLRRPKFLDMTYGLESSGNLHDILPVGNSVSQFWTHKHDGVTYCVALQRLGLIYALQIFRIQDGEPGLISQSLFFDEAQSMDVSFS